MCALYCITLFFTLHANCRKVVAVNLEARITREVTYPSQQGRERAALEVDGVLVVSLFVTLIMESPLARGPWVRPTNEAPLLQVSPADSVQPNLASTPIRIQYAIKMNILYNI